MAAAYSIDIRQKILSAWQNKEGTQRELAARFKVSLSFISEFFRQYRETGKITPKPQGEDRRSKIKGKEEELLKKIVTEQSDIYLREIQATRKDQREIEVSISSLSRTLKRLNLRRKRKTLVATEQETQKVQEMRHEFRRWLDTIDVKNLVFIDETGVNLAMTRNYGRCVGGERVYDDRPGNKGKNITLIGAMSDEGLIATMTFPGSLNTASFVVFVEQILLPQLWMGAIVVMDNLPVHYAEKAKALIESVGAKVKFLPPYSPDLSPIELCWSKLKEILRSAKARSSDALDEAITMAVNAITGENALSWFNHCGLFFDSV
jgi:transposase